MIVLGVGILSLAVLVAWTLVYTWVVVKKERAKLKLAGVLLAVLVAASPLAWAYSDDQRKERAFQDAVGAFEGRNDPTAQLLSVVKGPRAWIYTYFADGERRIMLRIGGDWLDVGFTPAEE